MAFEFRKFVNTRIFKTIAICLAYTSVVWSSALLGPNLLELRVLADVTENQISWLVPATYSGFGVGGLLITFFGHKLDLQIAMMICLVMTVVTTGLIPWFPYLLELAGCMFVGGISAGLIESAAIAYILHLWGNESTAVLQVVDFLFGLGSMLGPTISKPFLNDDDNQRNRSDLQIVYPYSSVAAFSAISLILFLIAYAIKQEDEPHPSRDVMESDLVAPVDPILKKTLIMLTLVYFQFFSGMGVIMGTYLVTYVTKSNFRLPKSIGALMSSVAWGIYTFLGLGSIYIIAKIGLRNVLIIENGMLVIAPILLILFGQINIYVLWIGVVMASAGGAAVFGAHLAFLEELFPISTKTTSLILISVCVGDIIWPWIVGQFVAQYPMAFIIGLSFCGMGCYITFAVILFVIDNYNLRRKAIKMTETIN